MKILGLTGAQNLVRDQRDLVLYPLRHWKPVKFSQYRFDVITPPSTRNHPSESILNPLQSLNVLSRCTIKQRIAIVQSCADYTAHYSVCHSSIQHRPDVTQSTDIKVACFHLISDVMIEREILVERYAEALELHRVRDGRSSDTNPRTPGKLFSIGFPCNEQNLRLVRIQEHSIASKPVSDRQRIVFELLNIRVRFNSNVQLCIISVLMELYAA